MKTNKNINLVMTAVAAVVLVAVNVGVWMAAGKGMIAPIDNLILWGAFVVLNVVSILWAISLLGLQPLVVALSYVVGGFLAFKGVRGMEEINVAEVATAGATYGAFGALAVGNASIKVRLAFFNKGQVPFVFILIGLLVLDAVLNSQISKAGGSVFVNAVVFPLVASGSIGAIWSILNRFGVGKKPSEKIAEADAAAEEMAEQKVEAVASEKLVIQMPDHAIDSDEEPEPAVAAQKVAAPEPVVAPEPQPIVAEELAEPVVAEEKKSDEEFFPLEIDKGEEFEMPEADSSLLEVVSLMDDGEKEDDSFSVPSFDAGLYASGSLDEDGGVMVEEPAVSVALDLDAESEALIAAEAPAEPETKQDAQPEPEPVREQPKQEEEKDSDWLGGHLELLNKLK